MMSGQALSVPQKHAVTVRRAQPEDAAICGRICYEAFSEINRKHGFPCDFPSAEAPVGVLSATFSHPHFYCVVAESDGRILGSNCLDERGAIAGVGPITIDPAVQNRGVGRQLMQAVIDRSREQGHAGIRLIQAAFHNRSLSLYSLLGFVVREPVSVMQGPAIGKAIEGCSVRAAQADDRPACDALCMRVHGHDRSLEFAEAIAHGAARVVERQGRITAYTTATAFFGHSVAESNLDLQALIASAESFGGPGILVPTRNAALFDWCLRNGLRVIEPMTLMSMGLYSEPAGSYLPSILF
jgi:GNAT superfamily N-acetyltransferase